MFQEDCDKDNFFSKNVMNKIKEDSFESTMFVRKLQGTMGGMKRLKSVWKPKKFTITKKGPRFETTTEKAF